MPRILIAECKQEVSSFNPVLSHYTDFSVRWGDDLVSLHRGGYSEMAGALSVFDARPDVELAPTYSARARTSAGTLAAADWERIACEFLERVRAAGPVDAVYYALHGAMAAEGEDDPEGYLLAETRKLLGEEIPIVVSLDLHAILTDRMLQHIDGFTGYHTYPHQDFHQTGARAARLLLRILDGQARPVMARVLIPALVRGDELKTETGLLGRFIREAQAIEASAGGLSAGMIIGNPFTDVPALASSSYVITDNDPDRAAREAVRLAEGFWAVRDQLHANLTPLDEAVRIAATAPGTTILTDAADAPSSGAPGDSNAILAALLDAGYSRRALIPIVDPAAVGVALAAGIGATIQVSVGGALDTLRFRPIQVSGRVRMLSDGRYYGETSGLPLSAGPTAVLEVGTITLIVTTLTVGLSDRSLFWGHGLDPRRYDAIVVKSPHCRFDMYDEWAARDLSVDAPGSTSANLPYLGHTQVRRPIYPLDKGVTFTPQAQIYRRH